MTDPSGLRVIEALCPSVSRYAEAVGYVAELMAAKPEKLTDDWVAVKSPRHGPYMFFNRALWGKSLGWCPISPCATWNPTK